MARVTRAKNHWSRLESVSYAGSLHGSCRQAGRGCHRRRWRGWGGSDDGSTNDAVLLLVVPSPELRRERLGFVPGLSIQGEQEGTFNR
jgi:hypothetical protein